MNYSLLIAHLHDDVIYLAVGWDSLNKNAGVATVGHSKRNIEYRIEMSCEIREQNRRRDNNQDQLKCNEIKCFAPPETTEEIATQSNN